MVFLHHLFHSKSPWIPCTDTIYLHFQVFGVQNGQSCMSDDEAHKNYANYGPATNCQHGRGGSFSNDIYEINDHNGSSSVHRS